MKKTDIIGIIADIVIIVLVATTGDIGFFRAMIITFLGSDIVERIYASVNRQKSNKELYDEYMNMLKGK